jgi:6-phosphofructokinase 1
MTSESTAKIGILVGGGPAPGLNGVIAAVTIEARRQGLEVYGFMDGYKWLVQSDEQKLHANIKMLRIRDVSRIHYDGGSILRTSRTNPAKIEGGLANSVHWLKTLGIKYMVTIGGDDTAYGASKIAEAAGGEIKFAHVPKTIDNDLPLPEDLPTFGYQTARHLGAELVTNLMEDARTAGRWYIAEVMGRHAGHLAIGIAKSSGATLAIIAEEFANKKYISLQHVCDMFEAAIIKRRAMGHNHGVMVISEGVIEKIDPAELKAMPGVNIEYDEYGHLRLSEIELGWLIKREMKKRFKSRNDKTVVVDINIGYVLRCAAPIPFDQDYTRDLGFSAVRYLLSDNPSHKENAMICVKNGKLIPLTFEKMIDKDTKKTTVRLVDITRESYKISRNYMIRLEKRDLEDAVFLAKLAEIAKMSPADFIQKYQYLVADPNIGPIFIGEGI